jgi:hypothetical protein
MPAHERSHPAVLANVWCTVLGRRAKQQARLRRLSSVSMRLLDGTPLTSAAGQKVLKKQRRKTLASWQSSARTADSEDAPWPLLKSK